MEELRDGRMMTHQVQAARQGSGAVLRCAICKADAAFGEDDFDGMNLFVREHVLCLDASR
jgi:hypothetical protein